MSVHPDLTAFRAVDACGGTYTEAEEASRFAEGHRLALDAALEAVKKPDVLMEELLRAALFAKAALFTLEAFEADLGEPLDDEIEVGRIPESSGSPSFRLRAGHIRLLAAAVTNATGDA